MSTAADHGPTANRPSAYGTFGPSAAAPKPPRPTRGHRRWIIPTVIGFFCLVLGDAMGRSSALGQVTALRATPAPTVTVTAEPVGKRVSATKKARPTHITNPADLPKPPAPVPAAPATIPGDGTYPIDPSDVPVGTYRSSGPSESNAVGCYWALLGADGSSIINNDITAGAAIIVIGQDASFVKTSGCQTFTRTS